jgi:hypothetical protein
VVEIFHPRNQDTTGTSLGWLFGGKILIIALMSFLRFLMLLSLVVWIGGIIFLAFVEAPIAFAPGLLPTRHMAGSIVGHSLDRLHHMGLVAGVIFLFSSALYYRMTARASRGDRQPAARRSHPPRVQPAARLVGKFREGGAAAGTDRAVPDGAGVGVIRRGGMVDPE